LPARIWSTIRAGLGQSLLWRGARIDLASQPCRRAADRVRIAEPELTRAVADSLLTYLKTYNHSRWVEEVFNSTFSMKGELGLTRLLMDIDTVTDLLHRFPIHAGGWMDLLSEQSRRLVFEGWARQIEGSSRRSQFAWDLGLQAARCGTRADVERLWSFVSDFDRGRPERLLVRTLLLKDVWGARALESMAPPSSRSELSQRWTFAAGMLGLAAEGLIELASDREAAWVSEVRSCAAHASDSAVSAQASILVGQLQLARARWRDASKSFQEACKHARRCGHARFLAGALERNAVAELELSRFSAARKFATECLTVARASGLFAQECLAFERLIEIARRRTDWERAFELATEYLVRTRAEGKNTTRAEACLKAL